MHLVDECIRLKQESQQAYDRNKHIASYDHQMLKGNADLIHKDIWKMAFKEHPITITYRDAVTQLLAFIYYDASEHEGLSNCHHREGCILCDYERKAKTPLEIALRVYHRAKQDYDEMRATAQAGIKTQLDVLTSQFDRQVRGLDFVESVRLLE